MKLGLKAGDLYKPGLDLPLSGGAAPISHQFHGSTSTGPLNLTGGFRARSLNIDLSPQIVDARGNRFNQFQ
jgi:hypothetical protein